MREVYVGMDKSKIKCDCLRGVYNDIANLLGIDAALELHTAFRGQQISFPVQLFTDEFIHSQILKYAMPQVPLQIAIATGVSALFEGRVLIKQQTKIGF